MTMRTPRLQAFSLLGNAVLLATLFWSRAEHNSSLRDLTLAAMRGDEAHLRIHAVSLAELEALDRDGESEHVLLLRQLTAAGEENIKLRQQLGLGE